MKGENCSVCGKDLYATKTVSHYELIPSCVEMDGDAVFPTTMQEYFCSEACLAKYIRDRIERMRASQLPAKAPRHCSYTLRYTMPPSSRAWAHSPR